MHSLTTHLRCPDDHGRLAFHPECPVCRRDRLVGFLPSEGIVSRRTQAVLASGVLALSAATPAAIAAEPDQERQGSLAPEQVAGSDRTGSTALDPGGDATDLRFDDAAAHPSPGAGGDETNAREDPATDAAPIIDAGDEDAGPAAQQVPAPVVPAPAPPVSLGQPSAPGEAPAGTPGPEQPVAASPQPSEDAKRRKADKPQRSKNDDTRRADAVTPGGPATPVPVQVSPPDKTLVVTRDRAEPGDRSHVVHAGESLWSVASDALGGERSAARIAREVNELWELNKDRIGTGDPDLIMVGTKLRLQ